MHLVRLGILLFSIGLSYVLTLSQEDSHGIQVDSAPASRPAQIPDHTPHAYYGLAIQVDTSYQSLERYGPMIDEIAELGANTILFSVNGYQKNAGSAEIYIDDQKTPPDDQWRTLLAQAHQKRLKIILMPKILLSAPRGKEWRGVIDPGHQWEQWFEQYGRFILHYARLAHECDVDVFMVGSELVSAEKHTDRWKKLISQVRQVYPRGILTYSSNWDNYEAIRFWDDLDWVSMTSYYQTAKSTNPELEELLESWKKYQNKILDWQKKKSKPILFTEVGWCSQEGCSTKPWNYYLNEKATPAGMEEQRRNYQAFIQTWQDCTPIVGTIWWEWTHEPGGLSDYSYAPKNKPAEQELRAWFQKLDQRLMNIQTDRPHTSRPQQNSPAKTSQ